MTGVIYASGWRLAMPIYMVTAYSAVVRICRKNRQKRINTRLGKWPNWADEARMEAIAKAARIRELVIRAEEAIERGRMDEARRLMALIHDKASDIEDIMRKAHDGKFRD